MSKSKMKFKNHFNVGEFDPLHERNINPSLTIPDQTMTVREIMERFRHGLPIDGEKAVFYDNENENGEIDIMPDVSKLDLSEIQALAEENAAKIRELQNNLSAANLAAKEREEYERLKAKYKEQELPFEEIKPEKKEESPK